MNQSEELAHPSAAPAFPTQELARLKWLVNRYLVTVDVFAHSLTDEFLPSEDALRDWTNNLSLLREAAFPISDFLLKNAGVLDTGAHCSFYQRVDQLIRCAIRCLIDRELADTFTPSQPISRSFSAADLLGQANVKLRSAIAILKSWLAVFGTLEANQPEIVDQTSPRRAVVLRLLDRQEQRLRKFIESDDRSIEHIYSQCMASRKLFLLSHYAAAIHPEVWTRERYERLLQAQDNLIGKLPEGSPSHQSIVHRRDQISESVVLRTWASV